MARKKQTTTELKLYQIDTMIYLTPKNIVNKLAMFSAFINHDGVAMADNLSINRAIALERFDKNYSISDIKNQNGTGQANETWLRKAGFLNSINGKYELSDVAKAIINGKISLSDYCFLILSKQWIKIKGIGGDDEYKFNLLALIFEDLLNSPSVTKESFVSHLNSLALNKYREDYDNLALSNQDAARYLVNPLLLSGIIKETSDSYTLSEKIRPIAEDYLLNYGSIRIIDEVECQEETYWNTFQFGFYDMVSDSNIMIYSKVFPNLLSMQGSNNSECALPLQQIYYGAPGTGKSHTIKKETVGQSVIRTTFHPDSDYSTFVGAYKPVMDDVDVHAAPVVVESGISIKPIGTYKEQRISYRFVKQAFLKSYLAAWKKYSEGRTHVVTATIKAPITFETDHYYTIKSVDDEGLKLSRESIMTKNSVSLEWQHLWPQGSFELPTGEQSGRSEEHAIAKWIYDNLENCSQGDFEKGWEKLIEKITNEESVTVRKTKAYIVTAFESETERVRIKAEEAGKSRVQLQKVYSSSSKNQLEKKLIEILKELNNSDFDDAWEKLKQAVANGTTVTQVMTYKPQFLIIEEINRGNCAQIFGDLFQLLDRSNNGYSTYPIDADTDIQREIERAFKEEQEYKIDSLDVDSNVVDDYESNYGASLADDILHGRILLLPPNLYIWATMNTSDQSLFPIDSAFKRRWDWEYLPICYQNTEWKIMIGTKTYRWVDFQKIINGKIYDVDNNSEDKQLGDYFVNADRTGNFISAETLLNKILFYLWNDVCKDDPGQIFQWKDDNDNNKDKSIKFSEFFCGKDEMERKLQGFMAFNGINALTEGTAQSEGAKEDQVESDSNDIENDDVNA